MIPLQAVDDPVRRRRRARASSWRATSSAQAIVFSIYGFGLVLLFVVFQAPDVALSALVVSGIAYPLVLVGAIAAFAHCRTRGE